MIGVIDYGAGNLASVLNMLVSLGIPARVVESEPELEGVERLVLPGVGHYDHGMEGLDHRGLVRPLARLVQDKRVPLMGICLGAQLLARGSAEGERPGLGWLEADVVAFDRTRMDPGLRVPHMGWAETWAMSADAGACSTVDHWSRALGEDSRFYYVHSFHLQCDHEQTAILRAHHGYEFAAGVGQANVVGFQFHPEKSHDHGRRMLEAFASWTPGSVEDS